MLMQDSGISELPDPYDPPKGCAFAARCPAADSLCRAQRPPLDTARGQPGHLAACFHPPGGAGRSKGGK
jgi:oligopeptide/dipeptide ABC transporter ATP-binding protein